MGVKRNFVRVPDDAVQVCWTCSECSLKVCITPSFHEESGNPMCTNCDREMEFDHVEVLKEAVK